MDAPRDFTFGRPGKWCHGPCGCKWPLEFFRLNPQGKNSCPGDRRARCKGCEGKRRHAVSPIRRWLQGTLTRHARQDGYADRHDMGHATGVTVAWLEPIIERELEHGNCPHCGLTWVELLTRYNERMELDRRDRSLPLTRSNVQLICKTGNRQKGKQSPAEFDISQRCWELYVSLGDALYVQLTLPIPL